MLVLELARVCRRSEEVETERDLERHFFGWSTKIECSSGSVSISVSVFSTTVLFSDSVEESRDSGMQVGVSVGAVVSRSWLPPSVSRAVVSELCSGSVGGACAGPTTGGSSAVGFRVELESRVGDFVDAS